MRVRLAAPIVVGIVALAACSNSGSDETSDSADLTDAATTDDSGEVDEATPDESAPEPTSTASLATAEPSTGPQFESPPADWGECSDDIPQILGAPPVECATIEVPLDYADPTGPTIPLALVRQPALGPASGSVVFNPGGPGGSGLEFLSTARFGVSDEVAQRFDLVSFDPRGVGDSASVNCDLTRDDGVALVADGDRDAW